MESTFLFQLRTLYVFAMPSWFTGRVEMVTFIFLLVTRQFYK